MRNDCIYSIKLYKVSKNGDKRLVLTFMDSYLLLKVKLADLANSFCPELGGRDLSITRMSPLINYLVLGKTL
jgi:hypothetical protein